MKPCRPVHKINAGMNNKMKSEERKTALLTGAIIISGLERSRVEFSPLSTVAVLPKPLICPKQPLRSGKALAVQIRANVFLFVCESDHIARIK